MGSLKSVYKERDLCYCRGLSENHFYRIKSNGIKELRDCLVFSETSKCVYCYPYKTISRSTSKLITGFQNWKTITTILLNIPHNICLPSALFRQDFRLLTG